MKKLSARNQLIWSMRTKEGMSQLAIADRLNLSQARVNQILKWILREISRDRAREKGLVYHRLDVEERERELLERLVREILDDCALDIGRPEQPLAYELLRKLLDVKHGFGYAGKGEPPFPRGYRGRGRPRNSGFEQGRPPITNNFDS